jgi:flagellar biosynthesis/type III secretory pathway M-ring protein FliF/YscJ
MSYQEIHGHQVIPEQRTDKVLRWAVRVGRGVLVLLVFGAVLSGFKQPMNEQNALREKIRGLKEQSASLQMERDKRLRRLNWIQTDEGYLEMEVRDRLNLQKNGEYVLRFED